MRIIISPAKKMNVNTDVFACHDLPPYMDKTEYLMKYMKSLTYEQCKAIWKCNDKIAELNFRRFSGMDLYKSLTPAILSYEGIQYQYMAPAVMEDRTFAYLQEHLRILSGFYGMLRPFDGVVPYRLEMQAKLGRHGDCPQMDSLYEYWGDTMAGDIFKEDKVILNLASKEYSKCITRYLHDSVTFVTCVFGELSEGKIKEKGTPAKMARGEMVRFLAEHEAHSMDDIRKFDRLGYRYREEYSGEDTLVFLKDNGGAAG
ncbi:peroxide stress protein YaaA [[Clostridium] hylemonae]|uniref:peroxide stress protein YaaA n=1 Tax=[Clostridium] hylemonae TaxID=89153 RepID=UPI001106BBD2|nr:peroxide stress protein YaaA [[Clostridium] hylemonae]